MIFKDKMHHITNALDNDGLVLLPTKSVWCIAANIHSVKALSNLLEIKGKSSSHPITIMVNSLVMLKHFFPNIHPRIETLLYYHERPLSIVYSSIESKLPKHIINTSSTLTIRMALDPLVIKLIDLMNEPIIVSAAKTDATYFPTSFDGIDAHIIRNMSYICQHRSDENGFEPEVIVSCNYQGELEFLRE